MDHILKTERLVLREFSFDDAGFIVQLLNSPGWIKFIGDRNVKTEEQAKVYLEKGPLKSYRENGYGLSLVLINRTGEKVGMCGILKRDNLDSPDIGFAFLPEYSGKGYAFEIANATVQFAREELDLPVLSAITLPHNKSSIKLLEKLGMKFVKAFSFENNPDVLLHYQF